jgi:hypothetical protein
LPDKIDVVIDYIALSEGLIEHMVHARNNLLRFDGRLIPEGFHISFVPVESKDDWDWITRVWQKDFHGIDLSSAKDAVISTAYSLDCDAAALLSKGLDVCPINLYDVSTEKVPVQGVREWVMNRKGVLHGFVH